MNIELSIKSEQPPKFRYELGNHSSRNFGCIFFGNEKIYKLYDYNDFYRVLGYTTEMNSNGILPEEFIWSEYHKDGAKKSDSCLQAKIIDYLFKNKIGFEYDFGKFYKHMIDSCTSEMLSDCKDCCLAKIF